MAEDEYWEYLKEQDAQLSSQGLFQAGELMIHVRREVASAGYPEDASAWDEHAVSLGRRVAESFIEQSRLIYGSQDQ